jgi:hypothetical protein
MREFFWGILSWRFASVLSPPGGERIEARGDGKKVIVLVKIGFK